MFHGSPGTYRPFMGRLHIVVLRTTNALGITLSFEKKLRASHYPRFLSALGTSCVLGSAFVQWFVCNLGMQVAFVPLDVARASPVFDLGFGAAVKAQGFRVKIICLEFLLCVVFVFIANRTCKEVWQTFSIPVDVCVDGVAYSVYDIDGS